ncbi:hypothetical protein BH23THE1_BH23THE1_34380 [soil metagenome]
MTKVTPQNISNMTQKHLHAKTLDEIVQETGLSKGTVYKIVKDWKQSIGGTDIEEIRAFIATVGKSEMTIQECAVGFRIAQMLKKLDIRDEFDDKKTQQWLDRNVDDDDLYTDNELADHLGIEHNKKNKNLKSSGGNQILYFLEKIYSNCKKYDIQPHIIVNWIQDLFDCYFSLEDEYPDNNAKGSNNNILKNKNSFIISRFGRGHQQR